RIYHIEEEIMKKVFNKIDTDSNDFVNVDELYNFMKSRSKHKKD
ncbi:5815_t:CDS:1, partial [Racocetra persica]